MVEQADNVMPAGRMEPDPPRTGDERQVNVPNPDGARCDFCQKRMVPYLMTVADHLGWERGRKCGVCYKASLFKDKDDNQQLAFDLEVAARIAAINASAAKLTEAPPKRVFPAIESTLNIQVAGMRVRLWFKSEKLEYDNRAFVTEICRKVVNRRHEGNPMMIEEIIRMAADLPNVAAIEVQDPLEYVHGDNYSVEVTNGVVAYVEWP